MIRYAGIVASSVVDGTGIRVTSFLQGCPFTCRGCHNPLLQSLSGGIEVAEEELAKLLIKEITPMHQGVTFSGGDPLIQAEALGRVITIIRAEKPELDIWVYTGYLYEQVKDWPVMKIIDILVDGPFMIDQKDLQLPFRGSRNQRIIDVRKSRETGVLKELAAF